VEKPRPPSQNMWGRDTPNPMIDTCAGLKTGLVVDPGLKSNWGCSGPKNSTDRGA